MNKNKKEYIDSINQIQVSDDLKKETLNKIKEKGRTKYRRAYAYASAAIIFVLILSIALPLGRNLNEIDPAKIIAENGGLPKVESFENLYKILNVGETSRTNRGWGWDSLWGETLNEATTQSDLSGAGVTREASQSESSTKSDDFSTTNVQIEGIDEADIVKTDGKYIYYISGTKIVIVDAQDAENLKIVNEFENTGKENENFRPTELFINNNKLILIGTKSIYNTNNDINPYARSMVYYPTLNYTVAKVYNVGNKADIILEREVEIEGYYLTARMIEDNIYFLANKYIYFYGVEIDELNEDEFKPTYRDTIAGDAISCIEFSDIRYFPGSEETSYLNIAGFNINDNKAANIETYLGAGETVFVSQTNIYVTNTTYEYKNPNRYGYYNNFVIKTNVYKFNLKGTKVDFDCLGTVPGAPLNQFSMDEKDGKFRIATTNNTSWNQETSTNNLYVLNENLEIVRKS